MAAARVISTEKHLGDRAEADGVEGLNDDGRPHQLSLRRDDEVQVSGAHVCARDLADAVTSHPWPNVNVGTRNAPYMARQLSVF